MRAASSLLLLFVLSCGGAVYDPTSSQRTGDATGGGDVSPTPPRGGGVPGQKKPDEPQSRAPAEPGTTACGMREVAPIDSVTTAIGRIRGVWDGCGSTPAFLCPASAPHLFFAGQPGSSMPPDLAVCGPWCGGDGGFCPTDDPAVHFKYRVVAGAAPGTYVLAVDPAAGGATRRWQLDFRGGDFARAVRLTSLDDGSITEIEAVGVPVR